MFLWKAEYREGIVQIRRRKGGNQLPANPRCSRLVLDKKETAENFSKTR